LNEGTEDWNLGLSLSICQVVWIVIAKLQRISRP